ncbi:MAG: aminopeptidase, partial [Planctomycetales bacterium]|nr:aminopeptidase [Planctomycetales bacterium]
MKDPRITQLATVLLDHSCKLQAGEKILIEAFDLPEPALVTELVRLASERGATPLVTWKDNRILRALYQHGTRDGISLIGELEKQRMEQMDCYVGIRGAANSSQFSDVPREQMDLYQECWWKPVHIEVRVPKTRWVVLRYPTPSFAQSARMSCDAFDDFFFSACTADYAQMERNQQPLKARMEQADQVRITGKETDLTFS